MPQISKHTVHVADPGPIGQPAVDPEPFFHIGNQTCLFQYPEVLAGGGLGQTQSLLNLAHAQHPSMKQLDHLDPVRVGQGLNDLDELSHGVSISLDWNITNQQRLIKREMFWAWP